MEDQSLQDRENKTKAKIDEIWNIGKNLYASNQPAGAADKLEALCEEFEQHRKEMQQVVKERNEVLRNAFLEDILQDTDM